MFKWSISYFAQDYTYEKTQSNDRKQVEEYTIRKVIHSNFKNPNIYFILFSVQFVVPFDGRKATQRAAHGKQVM